MISLGLVISVGGAFLSWTMLCAEIPYAAAKDGTFPRWFGAENAAGFAGQFAVGDQWHWSRSFCSSRLFASSSYQFLYSVASVAILPPYVFSGAYALKLAITGESYSANDPARARDMRRGSDGNRLRAVALLRGRSQLPAARHDFIRAGDLHLHDAPAGSSGQRMFAVPELVVALAITIAALIAIRELITGGISI